MTITEQIEKAKSTVKRKNDLHVNEMMTIIEKNTNLNSDGKKTVDNYGVMVDSYFLGLAKGLETKKR